MLAPDDVRVVFDDVLGREPVDLIDMAGATARALHGRRLHSVPHRVEGALDTTLWSFCVPGKRVVGAETEVPKGHYPLFDRIRDRFRAAIGKPKLVRVDRQMTYIEFCKDRLNHLENAFAAHISDGHGGQEFEEDSQMMAEPVQELVGGYRPISLPGINRRASAHLDGDEIIVSAQTPYGIVTTGEPIHREFIDVVECAGDIGCEEPLVIGAALAPITASYRILGELSRLEPMEEGVYALVPDSDPEMAAMIGLLQKAQTGNRQATKEAIFLSQETDLVGKAGRILVEAQREKARRVS